MKLKHFLFGMMIAIVPCVLISCGDDDDPVKSENSGNNSTDDPTDNTLIPANEAWESQKQKEYLEDVALELNGMMPVGDFRHYSDLAKYVDETYIDGYKWDNMEDWAKDILDGLLSDLIKRDTIQGESYEYSWGSYVYNEIYSHYKSTVMASNFKGHWTARNGKWQYADADDLQFIFKNKSGQECVLKLTTSGNVAKVRLMDLDDWKNYESFEEKIDGPKYTATITENGNQMTLTITYPNVYTEVMTATFDANDQVIRFIITETYASKALADAAEADFREMEDFNYQRNGNTFTFDMTEDFKRFTKSDIQVYFNIYKENIEKNQDNQDTQYYKYTYNEYYDRTEYTIGVPEKIEVTLTEGGTELIKQTVNTKLGSIANDEFDLSKSTLEFNSTTTLSNGYEIKVNNMKFAPNATSVETVVNKNKKTLIKVTASSNLKGIPKKLLTDWYNMDDDEIEDAFSNTTADGAFSVNVLGKVQVVGKVTDAHKLFDYMDEASENDENEQKYKTAIANANKCYEASIYYNGGTFRQAYLSLTPIADRYTSWDGTTHTEWEAEATINFPDGTSYSIESYFSEDDFKDLIDAIEKQSDDAEDMWD